MTARFIVGDVFDVLATLEDGSVDLVVTSPPFLALRSYLPADHPLKDKEIGSESTPAAFIDVMLAVTKELRRVLAPHGSICMELGDTYTGARGYGQPEDAVYGQRHEELWEAVKPARTFKKDNDGWPLSKSKALIPELYRIALAYGINPLTGQESPAGKWRVRNTVTWCRPNPPVGALGDKWRPATSDVVVACTSGRRYWDDLATRKPHQNGRNEKPVQVTTNHGGNKESRQDYGESFYNAGNASGAPLLDYWEIPPTGYSGSHYAVFPPALVVPLIQAMAPPRVCRVCGEPSRRIVNHTRTLSTTDSTSSRGRPISQGGPLVAEKDLAVTNETVGWSDCGCCRDAEWTEGPQGRYLEACDGDHWRPALILDPFAGSGTTLLVATGYGHDALGIDLDSRNAELALERVGPFLLEVEVPLSILGEQP